MGLLPASTPPALARMVSGGGVAHFCPTSPPQVIAVLQGAQRLPFLMNCWSYPDGDTELSGLSGASQNWWHVGFSAYAVLRQAGRVKHADDDSSRFGVQVGDVLFVI
jgi:hypothetical protein